MKLYLSSYQIPELSSLKVLLGNELKDIKMALVPNAGDYYSERTKSVKISDRIDYFKSLGFENISVVDLAKFNDKNKLKDALSEVDFIWVSGGNTFCLRHQMKRSGFDTIISDILNSGIVYGGDSAGAAVAGNSIKGIELADDPRFSESVQYDGLNLTPNYILPHADSIDFADYTKQMLEEHKDDPTLVILNDNQALVINGNESDIVTGEQIETL